ncbi:unnamed protein product [Ceutorhynchus assimilis]|uniref:CHK kinase-like domain-containing protein n=1 Tax=Ceutorhynchus assimilis TaxID=467358 RepID=A0A9N9QAX6_9CUCU|nr:unnamed protein product [Ceutorhynchus assimilis]
MATNDTRYSIRDVENVVQSIEGKIKSTTVSKPTRPGDNFVSLILQVDFDLEKNGKSRSVSATESLIAKRLPPSRQNREFAALGMKNEIQWYKEILPLLRDFAIANTIEVNYYADYMGSRLNMDPNLTELDDEAVLLLKNLKSEGFKNEDRFVGFDLPTTKESLRMLAHFHALPLVMKFKAPEVFATLKNYLNTCQLGVPPPTPTAQSLDWFPTNPAARKPPTNLVIEQMMQLPGCQPYKIQLQAMKNNETDLAEHKFAAEPWNTIVHGDYWVNNIMLKPRIEMEPRVKMLDFQFLEYGSFGLDVVFFLLSSVKNDIQKNHLDDLIKFYYNELTGVLDKQDVSELKLTYEDYLAELKRCAKTLGIEHLLFISCIIFGPKEGPDVSLGEIKMLDHLKNIAENMNQNHKDKLELILKLAGQRGWI